MFRVPARLAGREAKCSQCQKSFQAVPVESPSSVSRTSSLAAGLPSPPEDSRIGTQVGDYRITGVLGRGGMGAVYEATDTKFGRQVAVKILPPEMVAQGPEHLQRFLREGRLAATLQHPNVVNVFQVGRDREIYFIAMELVRGGSASAFLKASGRPLSPKAATRIIREVAGGLSAAHRHGIVHRDVKPANIMLGEHGLVKLADFGLAKNTGGSDVSVTGVGGVIGTPSYMSPEQIQGREVDARSDIYSLGATYFCLMVGRPPFYSDNPATVLYRHVHEPPPDPRLERPEIPEACTFIIQKALSKDPEQRYATADAMLRDLDSVDFNVGASAGSDDTMSAWLQGLADVGEGALTDPRSVIRKRRQWTMQSVQAVVRKVTNPVVAARNYILALLVIAGLAVAGWYTLGPYLEMARDGIRSIMGKKGE
jgi:serine/threonine protein kinase